MQKRGIDVFLAEILLFLLPLAYLQGYGSYNAFRYFFFGTMALILSVFAVRRVMQNKALFISFFKSWYFYGLVGYLGAFLLVSVFSINPAVSFWSIFQRTEGAFTAIFLSLFAFSICSIVSVHGAKVVKRLLVSSIAGALILSIIITLSQDGLGLLNWEWLELAKGGAMIGNSSLAASYILWNIFFALILFISSESRRDKIILCIGAFFLAFSPMFVNLGFLMGRGGDSGLLSVLGSARGATLGIVFGLIIALGVYLSLHTHKIRKYIGIAIVVAMFLGISVTSFFILQPSSHLHQKFIDHIGENRFIFWDVAWQGFKEHPVLGVGPSTFNHSFHEFFNPEILKPQGGGELLADEAHNIIFDILRSGGVVLLLSLLFLLFSIIYSFIKLAKQGKLSRLEASLFLGAMFGWFFQNLFVFDSISSAAMLFLVCGIAYGSIHHVETKNHPVKRLSNKHKFILVFYILAAATLFIYAIALPYHKTRTMNSVYKTKLPYRAALWGSFEGITPMGDYADTVLMFNNVYQSYNKAKETLRDGDKRKREAVLQELDAISFYLSKLLDTSQEDNYDLIIFAAKLSYIRMYIGSDATGPIYGKTMDLLARAIALSPADPQPYWTKSLLEVAVNNYSESKKTLEKAFSLAPYLERTHVLLLQLASMMHDDLYYNSVVKRVRENNPGLIIKNK